MQTDNEKKLMEVVSVRSDSLKAAKRRSWAASEGTTMAEGDMIQRILAEQRRGSTHFVVEEPQLIEEDRKKKTEEEEVRREVEKISPPTTLGMPTEEGTKKMEEDETLRSDEEVQEKCIEVNRQTDTMHACD